MARNTELIRQWEILRAADGAKNGVAIAQLATELEVHQRTIRRDIDALCRAGFPLYDERINGTTMWKLGAKPFRALENGGLGTAELCALYFGRTILASLPGSAFLDNVDRALIKVERALPPSCRPLLDRLPTMVKAKGTGRKRFDQRKSQEFIDRATDAALSRRRAVMTYFSLHSGRVREYTIEPLRLVYADGGIYLLAWVCDYQEMRTFAVERMRTLQLRDDRFDPRPQPVEPFEHSLGVHSGTPECIAIEFDVRAAEFITEREWHRSMTIEERPDGSLLARLTVCNDRALRRWIHGFGSLARVVSPTSLAQEILEEIEEARARYRPRLEFEPTPAAPVSNQPRLPVAYQGWKAS